MITVVRLVVLPDAPQSDVDKALQRIYHFHPYAIVGRTKEELTEIITWNGDGPLERHNAPGVRLYALPAVIDKAASTSPHVVLDWKVVEWRKGKEPRRNLFPLFVRIANGIVDSDGLEV